MWVHSKVKLAKVAEYDCESRLCHAIDIAFCQSRLLNDGAPDPSVFVGDVLHVGTSVVNHCG